MRTDAHYKCPTRFLARSTGGWRSLHVYRFAYYQRTCDHSPPLHCYHGSELPYVWGHPWQTPCRRPRFTPSEQQLSDSMREFWANLIRSGRGPNSEDGHGDSMGEDAEAAAASTARRRMLRGGQPHGSKAAMEEGGGGGVFWPAFREGQDERMLRFDAHNITLVPVDRHEACDFWDTTGVYT